MLDSFIGNVFGRPKNKNPTSARNSSQNDQGNTSANLDAGGGGRLPDGQYPKGGSQMTGPFSMSMPQMPQMPNMPPYPIAAPYPTGPPQTNPTGYYPSLPFSQPPPLPSQYNPSNPNAPATGQSSFNTISKNVSPLDSVPFEAKLSISGSAKNLTNLDGLFKEIKKAADVVDRADAYLRSSQSDYDFKIEQGLIYQ